MKIREDWMEMLWSMAGWCGLAICVAWLAWMLFIRHHVQD